MNLKLKPMEILRLIGNLIFSAAAVVYTVGVYNAFGFDLSLGVAMLICALICSTQILIFFRRIGTFPAWLVMAVLFLLSIFLCKDTGTGLLIGAFSISIPLSVSFFWPPLRRIAPLTKWALPTAGGLLFFSTLGYSALHFDSFSFAPIQARIAEKWVRMIKETMPLMQKVYPAELFKKVKPVLELMTKEEQANLQAFKFLLIAVLAMFGIYFVAVFLADWRLKREGEKRWCGSWSVLIPPRGISWAYMLINIFGGLTSQKIFLPLNATMLLFGFFYVFVAVYKLERMMAHKKVHGILRSLVVVLLFGMAFFSAGSGVYTILMFIGWWIATSPVRVGINK